MIGNISDIKSKIYEWDCLKFDQEKFILGYFSVDWEELLKIDTLNANNLDKTNMLLDVYAPLKRINKYKLKIMSKPWITLSLQKSKITHM